MTPELEKQYREKLEEALRTGHAILNKRWRGDGRGRSGDPHSRRFTALERRQRRGVHTRRPQRGGTTNKRYGRIGDSPIIGAGTYAENESVAVSCTGTGEYFIRWTVAYDIAALYKYRNLTVQQAGDEVIHKKLAPAGGDGGAIILEAKGNFAMPFNTPGMYRGYIAADGVPHVLMFKE